MDVTPRMKWDDGKKQLNLSSSQPPANQPTSQPAPYRSVSTITPDFLCDLWDPGCELLAFVM